MSEPLRIEIPWDHKNPVTRALIAVDKIIEDSALAEDEIRAITSFINLKYGKKET